ncbi:hypothetical protein NL676_021935 [Syzygium grande]|nr:hypothetical protein NL676_021935 [Syzygium grande]
MWVNGKAGSGHEGVGELWSTGRKSIRPANKPLPKLRGSEYRLSAGASSRRCNSKGRGGSIYDPVFGISCHFCRQKKLCGEEDCKRCGNLDMDEPCIGKTDCSVCHSAIGVLCRACLKVRYGEEMEEVRENKDWMCPHCVEATGSNPYWICNSSICLKKRNRAPTGIAVYRDFQGTQKPISPSRLPQKSSRAGSALSFLPPPPTLRFRATKKLRTLYTFPSPFVEPLALALALALSLCDCNGSRQQARFLLRGRFTSPPSEPLLLLLLLPRSTAPHLRPPLHPPPPPTPSSPFTERHSPERYRRDRWLYADSPCRPPLPSSSSSSSGSGGSSTAAAAASDPDSLEQDDIALQLPELRNLLRVLKEKRERACGGGGGGGEKCGPGNVYLVGTGPGDPELLTLKAVRVIRGADLLLYDRLVSNDVLELVGPGARLLYVGKTAGYHSRTQEEIHELLLNFAEAGATVVRLKGGDPLVFGRGGEEMDFLQQQSIQVQVIPGITAASGIAAELGVPLTHRGVANSVRFLTGHSRKGGTDPLFVAENAADPDSTLVVYMGLSTLPSLAQKLMDHGLPPSTPAAAVERGTTPQQRVVFAELKDLADKISAEKLVSPTLIIIGKVVALSPFYSNSFEEASMLVEAK